jgi:N-acetylglucosaminyl-diphospho-decaprenol L-rhamnosyltransferase
MTDPSAAELAIVIVNYNTAGYLERCLASLERHRGDLAVDVLVIDNASHDASHLRAVNVHPWARLVENPTNVYLSPAWNQGARETKAPWLLFLNPDTEWFHGTLADYVRAARAHPRAGIVGPMIRNPDGSVYPSGRRFPSVVDAVGHAFVSPFTRRNPFTRRYEMDGWDRTTERVVDWVSGASMLMPREAYDEVGACRLATRGWQVVFTPAVEVLHEIGVSRGRSRAIVRMHSRSIYRYYALHRARGLLRLTLPLARVALRARAEIAWLRGRFEDR